jgi:arabinogalactan oligomer/maltooligosaccharide transport system substrate-binding protein
MKWKETIQTTWLLGCLMLVSALSAQEAVVQDDHWNIPFGQTDSAEQLVKEYDILRRALANFAQTLNPADQAAMIHSPAPVVAGLSYAEILALEEQIEEMRRHGSQAGAVLLRWAEKGWFKESYSSIENRIGMVKSFHLDTFLKAEAFLGDHLEEGSYRQLFAAVDISPFNQPTFHDLYRGISVVDLFSAYLPLEDVGGHRTKGLLEMSRQQVLDLLEEGPLRGMLLALAEVHKVAGNQSVFEDYFRLILEDYPPISSTTDFLDCLIILSYLRGDAYKTYGPVFWGLLQEAEFTMNPQYLYFPYGAAAMLAHHKGEKDLGQAFFQKAIQNYPKIRDMGWDEIHWHFLLQYHYGEREAWEEGLESWAARLNLEDYQVGEAEHWRLPAALMQIGEVRRAGEIARALMEEQSLYTFQKNPWFIDYLVQQFLLDPLGQQSPGVFYPLIDAMVKVEAMIPQTSEEPELVQTPIQGPIHNKNEELFLFGSNPSGSTLVIWTDEIRNTGALAYVHGLAQDYYKSLDSEEQDLQLQVHYKAPRDMLQALLDEDSSVNPPDLLWTSADYLAQYVGAGRLLPLEDRFDSDKYLAMQVESVQLEDSTWAVPVSNGNHLMLMYNKSLLPEAPSTTDEMIEIGIELTKGDRYGLVFPQEEGLWLVPWLKAFGGSLVQEDGSTVSLNTQPMVETLQFIWDLKYVHGIIPQETSEAEADRLFREGKAAMIITGDWNLGENLNLMMEYLGTAPIPALSQTGLRPRPYHSGKYLFFSHHLAQDPLKLERAHSFTEFATKLKNQQDLVYYLMRLPSLNETYEQELLFDEEYMDLLLGSAEQLRSADLPLSHPRMDDIWAAVHYGLSKLMNNQSSPLEAALLMQSRFDETR